MKAYEVISVDSHLETHPDLWRSYVDSDFRKHVPSVVEVKGGGYGLRALNGSVVDFALSFFNPAGTYEGRWKSARVHGLNYGPGVLGGGDGEQRLHEMDQDAVDAEVLFQGIGISVAQQSAARESQEALAAVIRGYNDWLSAEYTAADHDRLWGLAILPPDVDDAIDEMRRMAGKPGIRGALSWPLCEPDDDRFWLAALELNMPLTAHFVGAGSKVPWPPTERADDLAGFSTEVPAPGPTRGFMQIIISGAFDRLPDLRLCYAETHIGWIPFMMERLDDLYEKHRLWADIELAHEPSWYFRNHVSWGFMIDPIGVKLRHHVGVKNIMWSTDFPHMNTDWPESRHVIDRVFADVPTEETRRMIRDNALEFFGVSTSN